MNAHTYGTIMACLEQQVHVSTFSFHKAAADHMRNYKSPNYGSVERMGAHLAAEMYKEAGLQVTPEFCIFDNLRKTANWYPELDRFVDPVYRAICHVLAEEQSKDAADVELVKKAMVGNVLGMLGKVMTASPAIAKTIMATGAATGAGLGALYWALNRHSTEDEDKLEAMKERIKLYKRITSEISEDLKRKGIVPSEDMQDTIQAHAGTRNII